MITTQAIERQAREKRAERLAQMSHDELIDDAAQFRGDMTDDESAGPARERALEAPPHQIRTGATA